MRLRRLGEALQLKLAHCHRDFVRRDALNEAPRGNVPHHPGDGLGGDIGSEVADHSEMILRERSERADGAKAHLVVAGVHGLEHIAGGIRPLEHFADHAVDPGGVVLVIDKAEVDMLAINIHIDLEVYPLVASGGVHELRVVGPGLPGDGVRDGLGLVHESSIHRIGGPMGLWWAVCQVATNPPARVEPAPMH